MLAWSEEFATGYPLVDTQHRMLINKINNLEQMLAGPPPPQVICDDLLSFLSSYMATHFKFEEGCMERAKCSAHEKNKQAHEEFRADFAKFKERFAKEGPQPELLKSLHTTAAGWIKDHILSVDIQLRACAKS
jgi:hemerythrin